jgi:hypothetical protein
MWLDVSGLALVLLGVSVLDGCRLLLLIGFRLHGVLCKKCQYETVTYNAIHGVQSAI